MQATLPVEFLHVWSMIGNKHQSLTLYYRISVQPISILIFEILPPSGTVTSAPVGQQYALWVCNMSSLFCSCLSLSLQWLCRRAQKAFRERQKVAYTSLKIHVFKNCCKSVSVGALNYLLATSFWRPLLVICHSSWEKQQQLIMIHFKYLPNVRSHDYHAQFCEEFSSRHYFPTRVAFTMWLMLVTIERIIVVAFQICTKILSWFADAPGRKVCFNETTWGYLEGPWRGE